MGYRSEPDKISVSEFSSSNRDLIGRRLSARTMSRWTIIPIIIPWLVDCKQMINVTRNGIMSTFFFFQILMISFQLNKLTDETIITAPSAAEGTYTKTLAKKIVANSTISPAKGLVYIIILSIIYYAIFYML